MNQKIVEKRIIFSNKLFREQIIKWKEYKIDKRFLSQNGKLIFIFKIIEFMYIQLDLKSREHFHFPLKNKNK